MFLKVFYIQLYVHSFVDKLKCFSKLFEKSSNIKFHENPSSGNRDVPSGRTDGQT